MRSSFFQYILALLIILSGLNSFAQEAGEDAPWEDNDHFREQRAEWYRSTRVLEDGSYPDLVDQKRLYDALNVSHRGERDIAQWTNISQTSADGGYNGMGRVTSVAFHPTDPDIFYIGAPIGGIWKTIDGGQTWSALGDSLPYLSVGNVVIDYDNPDVLYITIGDHTGWWNYGIGVYKSTDAGLTWNPTSHTSSFTQNIAYLDMTINPVYHNEIFVAQTNGLFRSQDGGDTWDLVHTGQHDQVLFMPGSPATLYTSVNDYWGSSEAYVSHDHGDTWETISDFNTAYASVQMSVTPADSLYIGLMHAHDAGQDFYYSEDAAATFYAGDPTPESGVIFFSPTNKHRLYCGYTIVYTSDDTGANWDQNTMWYDQAPYHTVHADEHEVVYHPLTNEIYFCNDGGLYKYHEGSDHWTDLSNGLIITQFYRIAVSQTDDNFMIGGTQDNGGRKRVGPNSWEATNGGDAMEVAINPFDDQTIYTTYVNGQLYRSHDQWNNDTYNDITPDATTGGAWVTPYVLDPNDPSVIVAGYEDVFRSTNEGNSWTQISSGLTGSADAKLEAIAVAPNDENVIYASQGFKFYSTFDGGANWNTTNAFTSTAQGAQVTSIVVHPTDPMKVWVTVGGYNSTIKVRYSSNGGASFSNATHNLPNVPVNCSVIDQTSANFDLYVGTDVGVFLYDALNAEWNYFGAGIPNTSVTDLEIQYPTQKLRAGTFGRGIWETDLASSPALHVAESTEASGHFSLGKNPTREELVLNCHFKEDLKAVIQIYSSNGQLVKSENAVFPMGNYQRIVPVPDFASGAYFVTISGDHFAPQTREFIISE